MTAVHKKQEKKNPQEAKGGSVAVSNIVVESVEQIEVVTAPTAPEDALTNFKEKMKEEESAPSPAQQKNFMWPIIFIFIIALIMLGGVFLYKQSVGKNEKINVVTLSPTPTFAPIPTKAELELSKYEIEIQNGGGISGEAGRQKTSLEEEGFTVSSIGNADSSDYTETIIKAKKEVEKAFVDKLKSVLGNTFTLGESEVLPNSSSVPVVVIIGAKK